jgi:hypothetical protein
LRQFTGAWNAVLKHSDYSKAVVKRLSTESFKRKSQVKWWTSFDQISQAFRIFDVLFPIASEIHGKGYSKVNNSTLLSVVQRNKEPYSKLALALSATVDIYGPFVDATHFMESRKFIAPFVYQRIVELKMFSETILKAQECPTNLPNDFALVFSFFSCFSMSQLADYFQMPP